MFRNLSQSALNGSAWHNSTGWDIHPMFSISIGLIQNYLGRIEGLHCTGLQGLEGGLAVLVVVGLIRQSR